MQESDEDALTEARRYLTDLMVFEGAKFIVPNEVTSNEVAVPSAADNAGMASENTGIAESSAVDSGSDEAAEAADRQVKAGNKTTGADRVAVASVVEAGDKADVASSAVGTEREDLDEAKISSEETVATALPGAEEGNALELFRQQICECTQCPLGATRKRFVFGAGDPAAGIMFVGEAPGAEEDRQGEPFVGAAGQLLTKIIAAMELRREDVYICNILKCRPPNNRDPQPAEIEQCEPYLKHQIELIQPKVICTLGRFAAQTLLRSSDSMGRMRGQVHHYEGIPLVATYHPAALLRNPQWKRPTWEDIKRVRQVYDGVEL